MSKTPLFEHEIFALLPARKGSKRIPFKNRYIVDGKPLFLHTMDNLYDSECFGEVVIASDDEKIKEICESYKNKNGAHYKCFDRYNDADDNATLSRFLFSFFLNNPSYFEKYKYVALCLPTAFLITSDIYKHVCHEFDRLLHEEKHRINTFFSSCLYPHPVERRFVYSKDFRKIKGPYAEIYLEEHKNKRTQDIKESFYDAGQFYILDIKKFMKSRNIFNIKKVPYFLNKYDFVDIDEIEDLKLAENLYKIKQIDAQ